MLEIKQYEETAVWYRPDILDNRERENPFRVLIAPMSGAELRRSEEQFGQVTKGKINFIRRHNKIRAAVLQRRIRDVEGLRITVVNNGNEESVEPKTAEELLKYATEELQEDIYTALKDHSVLAEGVEKK